MTGTKINYIAGPRNTSIGWGKFYPQDLTADSQPNVDEWGPDNYWSAQTYVDWFMMNRQAYGEETAISKMLIAIDSWSGLGGIELDYCYDQAFVNFFSQYGIDVRTHACSVINDALDVVTDTTATAARVSKILSLLIPATLIVGTVWVVRSGTAQKFVKRKLAA